MALIAMADSGPTISVVVPCFNEADSIAAFHTRLTAAMAVTAESWEIVYVNDGSADRTWPALTELARRDARVGLVNLTRNFGKEIALTAGLDHARATEAVIIIDADLQDPPELIPELVRVWRERGIDNVYAQRRARAGESWAKRSSASMFYRLMQRLGDRLEMPRDTGDFRLLSRRGTNALLRLREQHRFMKGMFAWIGFSSEAVLYDREPRYAGRSSWNFWQLWNLALEGITGFTVVPLKLATYLGLATAILALLFGLQLVVRTLVFGSDVHGYPSIMAVMLFLGGVQLITLGVIGEYLGRIFNETKQRPLYLVETSRLASMEFNDRTEPAKPAWAHAASTPSRHEA
jgi:glycosyltransferase involved in cell wall biosynthesis